MNPSNLKGMEELTEDIKAIHQRFLARCTYEERIRGVPPEEILAALSPEDRRRMNRGLPLEEILAALSPEDRQRLKQLI